MITIIGTKVGLNPREVKDRNVALGKSPYGKPNQGPFFDNQLLDYDSAANFLGISVSYLRRLKRKKQIRFVRVGRRSVRFRVASLNSWVTEREAHI